MERKFRAFRGFSLVELLVVTAIIAVLIAILLPTLSVVRKASRSTACLANLQQWGQSYQMYLSSYQVKAIPEQTNDDTTQLWWEALSPFNGDVKSSLLCPEALESRNGSRPRHFSRGTASNAWRKQTWAVGRPQLIERGDWLGSYAFNVWAYKHAQFGQYPGSTSAHYFRIPASQATRMPLLGDSVLPYAVPLSSDAVPPNLSDPGEGSGGIGGFCIDRHRMAINILFLDGHAEHIPLSQLWQLQWSEDAQPRSITIPGN